MHDIRLIRENPEAFDAALARRGVEPAAQGLLAADAAARGLTTRLQEMLAERNEASKAIGAAKAARDEARAAEVMARVAALKEAVPQVEAEQKAAGEALAAALAALPNVADDAVPFGGGEDDNVEVKRWGVGRPAAGARDHVDLGAALGLDFESAQVVSGARFAYLRGPVARLSRALGQFMLDTHTGRFGYEEVVPPVIVRSDALYGTAQLPKFAEDLFRVSSGLLEPRAAMEAMGFDRATAQTLSSERWLIPTAEVSLTNLVREKILSEEVLPLRFTALTPCFRSEAGAAGKDTRGLIRQHQFEKVELVSITHPDESAAEHERMTAAAEFVLEALELPYRRMLLCSGDMGFSARRTFDLEVWLPGQDRYREISSCSNCGDFQARRMDARFRATGQQKGTQFVHTLNGSGLAVGRTLVAVLENWQRGDGAVEVPPALRPWMGGVEAIEPVR